MTPKLKTTGLLAIASSALVLGAGAATSTAGTSSAANQLTGTWRQTVVPAGPVPTVRSLVTYSADGTSVETSNQPPASRSPMLSSWERIEGRVYAATGEHFLFDPETGQFAGTRRITRTIELAQDGQSFTAIAHVTTFDPNGNVLASFTANASAERMEVES